ncbi:reverse transcriptase domain-containing protein [Tanacetum coccineum]
MKKEKWNQDEPVRAATPPLRAASPRVRRRRERVVGFEETQNRGESRVERNSEGGRPLEEASRGNGSQNALPNNEGGNLPPNAHGLPSANSDRKPPYRGSFANLPQGGHVPSTFTNGNILPQNGFTHPVNIPPNSYPFYTQPMYTFPNMPAYANPNSTGLFPNPLGSVTPFVRWIEDYPLPDGLKMPSHIGSYDGKGDPDNFLHLFEGAIRMQKWLMPVACHMFTYTLKDSARIWWNSQKAGSILDYEDLKAKFRSHFSQQKKFTKTHLAVHNIKQRENESTRAFITRYTDDTLQILGLHEDQRISGFIHGLRTRSLVEHLSTDLPPTYKGLMEKMYTWVEAREVATNGVSSDQRDSFERPKKSAWDNNKGRKKKTGSPPIEGRTTACSLICPKVQEKFMPQKEPQKASNHLPRCLEANDHKIPPSTVISMKNTISREDYAEKNTISKSMAYKEEITFPPVTRVSNAPVIIEAAVFRRKVGRVYMDSGSTCEVIYEHFFEKLNPTIKATRVNTKTPLVRFLGNRSWFVGEVPLEITIREHPLSRTKTLNFVIVKSDSPHNMLLGRTAMQKMGIVVSTIHGTIKFHTKKEVRTVLSIGKAREETKKARRTVTISKERIPSYDDTGEKIIVNDKYPEQMVTIGKQLPEHFKKELRNLLRANADIFAWTHADMTCMDTCRHDRNSENHHGPDCNTAACKEAKELTKAETLRKVKHQTWVANPVMVKNNDGGWRMCVDFTDINKACPKDCYPLPEIDWKIEPLAGFHLKCFLDVYKGYHQIQMAEGDEDKTTFFGIKSNPTKIKAVTKLEQPRVLKDIQNLNRKLEAISHFLSKGAERSLPFFKVLKNYKGKRKIHWTDEADKAFKEIKKFVQALPTLTAPRAGETLTMYLAESKESINAALFAKRSEERIPIYFISKVLQGAELNYPALEKLILALVHAARRHQRYFQAHTIMVPTGTPIKQALTGPEKTRRVAKWAIELGEHDIIFLKRDQRETLADFLPEIPFDDSEKKVKEKEVSDLSNEWKLYTDRASSPIGAGAGLMLIDLAGKEYTYALRFEFETTNNEAEYEALLARLHIAQEMEITKVAIFLDSQLVVNQIKGTYAAKQLSIKSYVQKVKTALNGFEWYTVEHVLVKVLAKRSIEEKEFLKVEIKEKRSWMSPIQEYLLTGLLPEDTNEARKIRIQVPQYKLFRGKLQKQFNTTINARNNPQYGKQGRMEPSQSEVRGLSAIRGFIS